MKKDKTNFDIYDVVKNINNEYSGVVIAAYPDIDGGPLIDVRLNDDSIYYHSDATKWIKIRGEDWLG